MPLEVDPAVAEAHAFFPQAAALHDGTAPGAEGDPPARTHNPVPRNRPGAGGFLEVMRSNVKALCGVF